MVVCAYSGMLVNSEMAGLLHPTPDSNVTAKAARPWKSIYVNFQNRKLVGEVRAKVTSEVMMQTVLGRGWRLPTGLWKPAEWCFPHCSRDFMKRSM